VTRSHNRDLADATAVILAGGFGTRLSSVVADRPKVLAEINGRPFLEYLFDQLSAAGIRGAVLCTGYLGQQVQETFGHSYREILQLNYSREMEPLGTGGALRLAASSLRSDVVLVMNGDSYCHTDLKTFWDRHHSTGAAATLLLARVPDTKRYGSVEVAPDGRVLRFAEKLDESKPGCINAGVYLISSQMLTSIPPNVPVSLERDVFPAWIDQGLYGFSGGDRFLDIGTPETFAAARKFLAQCLPQ
jgi:D-glycero-alpha-D-manno-heptose 1-phosphate guanylyltransferase